MDDLISRQAAIDALKEHRALFCDNTPDTFSKLSYAEKSRVDELDMAIATLINLPPAQPERKNGAWINEGRIIRCNRCKTGYAVVKGMKSALTYNFCPNCGADMRGEQDDTD